MGMFSFIVRRYLISGLSDLEELYLDNNNLHKMHMMALEGTSLRIMHLQNNFLDFRNIEDLDLEIASPFQELYRLEILNMRNNSMKSFLNHWHIENTALQQLDLSYNKIERIDFGFMFNIWMKPITIDVSHNNITTIDSTNDFGDDSHTQVKWIFNHNPLKCDCVVMHFASYLQNKTRRSVNSHIQLVTDELECASPSPLAKKRLENVSLFDLICPLDGEMTSNKKCPTNCNCFVRTIDKTAVFNCSNADLTKVPTLPRIKNSGLKFYELYIENNNITTLPLANTTGYENVNRLLAKNNSITNISPGQLPNNLFELDLSSNKLKRIHPGVLMELNHMKNLRNVTLNRNPWTCDCAAYDLFQFIENRASKSTGNDKIICDNGETFTSNDANRLCVQKITIIIVVAVVIFVVLVMLVFVLSTTTFYYKNYEAVMVWMIDHGGFGWFFKPKPEEGREFDAFILYSQADEDFVDEKLISKLENGPNPLKLCLLKRELKGGDLMPEQVRKKNICLIIEF